MADLRHETTGSNRTAGTEPAGKKILIVVEDNERLSLMKTKLERVGYILTTASTAEQAAAYLGMRRFDLVVVEVTQEHQRDVIAVVSQIKMAMPANTPLLAIAAVTPGGRVHNGLLSVANLSILAPYHTVELIRAVERALAIR